MATRTGYLLRSCAASNATPGISSDIDGYEGTGWPPGHFDVGTLRAFNARTAHLPIQSLQAARLGWRMRSYMDDMYYRIYVRPTAIDLGNLVTAQVRQVSIWNAWPNTVQTLTGADVANGEGIDVQLPGMLPLAFRPLQERVIELALSSEGPAIIDAALLLEWAGLTSITVTISGRRLKAWPVMADWGSSVRETLAWLTEIQEAVDGNEDRESLREAPRRSWGFDLVEGRFERRLIENAVFDWAGRVWALPIATDIELLAAPLAAGSMVIPADTVGLDFSAGGVAVLWSAANRFELVELDTVAPTQLTLARPTLQDWPAGSRLYPCRTARLSQAPTWRRKNDQVITAQVEFDATEPCDWPSLAPATVYRGYPVLEWRIDEGDDPTASTPRALEIIDGDVGLLSVDDISNLARGQQSHAFVLHGRAERAAHRSLLYWLAGRYQALWVPTWTDDIELLDTVLAGSRTLFVANAGVSSDLRQQPGRRHVRIELNTGALYYREVLSSQLLDSAREQLLLDLALDIDLVPGQIRVISWMALQRQASDRVEISHVDDSRGTARSSTAFTMVGGEEP